MSEIKDEFDHFLEKLKIIQIRILMRPGLYLDRPAPDPQRWFTVILFLSVYRAPLPREPSLM
jgi:hypothetical protein